MDLRFDAGCSVPIVSYDATTPYAVECSSEGGVLFRLGDGEPEERAIIEWSPSAESVRLRLDASGVERLLFAAHEGTLFVTNDTENAAAFIARNGGRLHCQSRPRMMSDPIFDGVESVGFSEEVVASFRSKRWHISRTRVEDDSPDDTQSVTASQLRGLLIQNTAELGASRGNIAILLSGGLDSSIVTACAAEAFDASRLTLVHFRFPNNTRAFESELARSVARHFGIKLIERELKIGQLANARALSSCAFFFNWHGWRDVVQREVARSADFVLWGARAAVFQGEHAFQISEREQPSTLAYALTRAARTPRNSAAAFLRSQVNTPGDSNLALRRSITTGLAYAYANKFAGQPVRTLTPFASSAILRAAAQLHGSILTNEKSILRHAFQGLLPQKVLDMPRVGTPMFPLEWYTPSGETVTLSVLESRAAALLEQRLR